MSQCKVAVALGGGAARGWAHIGVLRALAEAGIHPDIVVGTSIGAVVGGCYAASELDAVERFALELTRRKVLGYLDLNFGGAGLISGQRLCGLLDSHLHDLAIEDLPRRYVAVATEIGTGHEIWLSRGHLVEAMRASYALPGIFRPVNINGRWLFDGALVNPIPVSVCRALGARYVIAVNLNADIGVRGTIITNPEPVVAEPMDLTDTDPISEGNLFRRNGRAMKRLLQRQFFGNSDGTSGPGISTVMLEAFNIVQDRIARSRLAGDPPDAIISPRLGSYGLFDFHRAEGLIETGKTAAQRCVEDIAREISIRRQTPARALHAS